MELFHKSESKSGKETAPFGYSDGSCLVGGVMFLPCPENRARDPKVPFDTGTIEYTLIYTEAGSTEPASVYIWLNKYYLSNFFTSR
jgi:hypothetical protein